MLIDHLRTTFFRRVEENGGQVAKARSGKRLVKVNQEMKDVLQEIVKQSQEFTLDMLNVESPNPLQR